MFLPKRALAAPSISITNYPSTVVVGDLFSIDFNVASSDIGYTYHFKAVGDTNTDISIFPSCASRYDDCLNVVIADPATNSATATLKINIAQTLNNIKIRLAKSDEHEKVYNSEYINIISILPSITPTPVATPTAIPTLVPTLILSPTDSPPPTSTPTPSPLLQNYLAINEIFANPDTGQDEWIEIKNASASAILIDKLCFYDALNNSRCLPENTNIGATSFYTHSFSSGFLNNDGDTVHFLDSIITYPKTPKNNSYSIQENNSWCFANPSQNFFNNECLSIASTSSSTTSSNNSDSPTLDLQSTLAPVFPGQKIILTFRLNSSEQYSLRLNSPFGNRYSTFGNYHDNYSWLDMELTVPKTLAVGSYPLEFHLKKEGTSRLIDYNHGILIVKESPKIINKTKVKTNTIPSVLGVSSFTSLLSSPSANCLSSSTLNPVSKDTNFFSWPFLFVGSILFLSPILFSKLYSD